MKTTMMTTTKQTQSNNNIVAAVCILPFFLKLGGGMEASNTGMMELNHRQLNNSTSNTTVTTTRIMNVTEFCSITNLQDIELYLTSKLNEEFPSSIMLTEEQNYVCVCSFGNNDEEEYLDLECSTFFFVPSVDDEHNSTAEASSTFPIVSTTERMEFIKKRKKRVINPTPSSSIGTTGEEKNNDEDNDGDNDHHQPPPEEDVANNNPNEYVYYYEAESVGKCEYLNYGNMQNEITIVEAPAYYCEELTLASIDDDSSSTTTAIRIDSCFIVSQYYFDDICKNHDIDDASSNNNNASVIECDVCDDNRQTIQIMFPPEECGDNDDNDDLSTIITCEEQYSGPYLFEHYMDNNASNVQLLDNTYNGDDNYANSEIQSCQNTGNNDDNDNNPLSLNQFCDDAYLLEMGTNLTRQFASYFPNVDIIVPYSCACRMATAILQVDCDLLYEEEKQEGQQQHDDLATTTKQARSFFQQRRETMEFTVSWNEGNLVPSYMELCFVVNDIETGTVNSLPYCESYTFGFHQTELISCKFGMGGEEDDDDDKQGNFCEATFCQICSDGLSVAYTCANNYVACGSNDNFRLGPFLFNYKHTRICLPAPPTVMPVPNPIIPTPSQPSPSSNSPKPMEPTTTNLSTSSPAFIQKTLNPTMAPAGGGDDENGNDDTSSGASPWNSFDLNAISTPLLIVMVMTANVNFAI